MIVALALVVGFSSQELPANEVRVVTLQFAWPERGRVRWNGTVKEGADAARTTAGELSWQRREPDASYEVRLATDAPTFDAEESAKPADGIEDSSSSLVRVDLVMELERTGRLRDARYLPRLHEELYDPASPHRERHMASLESLHKALQSPAQHAQAVQQATEVWNPWIACWAGQEVSLETPVERTREVQWPNTSGTVLHHESISGIGITEDSDGLWLHARLDSSSDPDAAREALRRTILDELGAIPEGERIPDVSRRESVEILVDVRTMRPRKVLSVTEVRMDGKLLRKIQSRWVFDWSPEAR